MPIKAIDPATLRQWLTQGHARLIDVREPAEHRACRIPEACNIPLAQVSASGLPQGDGAIVIHCLKGGRGSAACETLVREDPNLEVYNLTGGIAAWDAAGLPVAKGRGVLLPLDRQVQLTLGLVLLAATGLALLLNPLFVVVCAVVGLGLTVAGLTGFCGLARLMARAPWNR